MRKTLASGSGSFDRDYTIGLWDAVTGKYKRVFTGYTAGVTSLAFSPDGETLASVCQDAIHLRDAVTGVHPANGSKTGKKMVC